MSFVEIWLISLLGECASYDRLTRVKYPTFSQPGGYKMPFHSYKDFLLNPSVNNNIHGDDQTMDTGGLLACVDKVAKVSYQAF